MSLHLTCFQPLHYHSELKSRNLPKKFPFPFPNSHFSNNHFKKFKKSELIFLQNHQNSTKIFKHRPKYFYPNLRGEKYNLSKWLELNNQFLVLSLPSSPTIFWRVSFSRAEQFYRGKLFSFMAYLKDSCPLGVSPSLAPAPAMAPYVCISIYPSKHARIVREALCELDLPFKKCGRRVIKIQVTVGEICFEGGSISY